MRVIWQPKAVKQLKKIREKTIRERILHATKELANFPDITNMKKLSHHEYGYRLRIGSWRILFNAFEEIDILSIEEVKKRDEHTY